MSKKMLLGLVALVCFVVVVSGCTTSSNTTSTNPNTSNTSGSNASASNDVLVEVNYPGSWAADVSGTFGYRSLAGNGKQTTNLGSISGPVTISARKTQGGNEILSVTITRGGQTLSTASTSSPWGAATAVFSV